MPPLSTASQAAAGGERQQQPRPDGGAVRQEPQPRGGTAAAVGAGSAAGFGASSVGAGGGAGVSNVAGGAGRVSGGDGGGGTARRAVPRSTAEWPPRLKHDRRSRTGRGNMVVPRDD